jgi:hypothetical protein
MLQATCFYEGEYGSEVVAPVIINLVNNGAKVQFHTPG